MLPWRSAKGELWWASAWSGWLPSFRVSKPLAWTEANGRKGWSYQKSKHSSHPSPNYYFLWDRNSSDSRDTKTTLKLWTSFNGFKILCVNVSHGSKALWVLQVEVNRDEGKNVWWLITQDKLELRSTFLFFFQLSLNIRPLQKIYQNQRCDQCKQITLKYTWCGAIYCQRRTSKSDSVKIILNTKSSSYLKVLSIMIVF